METDDLHKAMAAFLICFGQTLPQNLKTTIKINCFRMAAEMDRNGEPNVGKLVREFGNALDMVSDSTH